MIGACDEMPPVDLLVSCGYVGACGLLALPLIRAKQHSYSAVGLQTYILFGDEISVCIFRVEFWSSITGKPSIIRVRERLPTILPGPVSAFGIDLSDDFVSGDLSGVAQP